MTGAGALPPGAAPLAVVVRGGLVESVHVGHLVVLGPDGAVRLAIGDPGVTLWPRSSLKPVQAVAMLRAGLEVGEAGLALACASHSGTPEHLGVVRGILAGAGLGEADLRNTPDLPLDPDAAFAWRSAGGAASSVTQNCSGKHAAMLATCVAAGWDLAGYLDPGHPLQQAIRAVVAELTAAPVSDVTVDGCGAPLFSTSLLGLARAFGRIGAAGSEGGGRHAAGVVDAAGVAGVAAVAGVAGAAGVAGVVGAEARVARAMRSHPWLVGGPGRDVSRFMAAVPGLVAKDGAEGVYAAGLPDGSAVAFKVADGSARPRAAILAAALEVALEVALGVGVADGVVGAALDAGVRAGVGDGVARDASVRGLREVGETPVLGHGRPVGQVVALVGARGGADADRSAQVGRQW